MAVLGPYAHSGLDTIDFSPGTVRADISPAAMAKLYNRPNLLGAIPIGAFGGGGIAAGQGAVQLVLHSWTEDRLNPRQVTETDGGINAAVTSFTVSTADGALLFPGTVLMDQSQDPSVGELVFVNSVVPGTPNSTVNVVRGYNGTTAAAHAANAIWLITGEGQVQGSDQGPDTSRVPGMKFNLIQTTRKDVTITGAMVSMAKAGMIPGVGNILADQLNNRIDEMFATWEHSFIRGIASPLGTATEYQYMWGTLAFLGRTNPKPNATTVTFDAGGSTLNDVNVVNPVCINIDSQGAEVPDIIVCNNVNVDKLGKIYRDQLRLSQDELIRGYFVDAIRSSIGTRPIRLVKSNYMPSSVIEFLNLQYLRIVPFLDRLCFLVSAPTTRDADLVAVISAMTLEMRYTGTDFGYAHQSAFNFS